MQSVRLARDAAGIGLSPGGGGALTSRMFDSPAVYVMRALSSGPRTMLGFLDMARLKLPFQPVGGGVPEESSCRPGHKLLKPVARAPGRPCRAGSRHRHVLETISVKAPFQDVLSA